MFTERYLNTREDNEFVYYYIVSLITALATSILVRFGIGHNIDKIMIGEIMLVIPGIAMTNAIRDLLMGDTGSGILRFINSVIIAGGFGSHLKKEDLTGVGILPKIVEKKIKYVGNSSLIGAYMALMNENIIKKMEELSQNITYLDLATSENYERKFAKAMQF